MGGMRGWDGMGWEGDEDGMGWEGDEDGMGLDGIGWLGIG